MCVHHIYCMPGYVWLCWKQTFTSPYSPHWDKSTISLYIHTWQSQYLLKKQHCLEKHVLREWKITEALPEPLHECTLLRYLQHYFIWSWYDGQTSQAEDAKHSSRASRCWLIMSPKKLISMIFWIRKNKHKRLTCKNIFYDWKYLKNDKISAMYKNINNIFIYIFFICYTH